MPMVFSRLGQKIGEKRGKRAKTAYSAEFQTAIEAVIAEKELTSKYVEKINSATQGYGQHNKSEKKNKYALVGESMREYAEQLDQCDGEENTDYKQTLTKISELMPQLAQLQFHFVQQIHQHVVDPMNKHQQTVIKSLAGNKSKLDKLRLNMDATAHKAGLVAGDEPDNDNMDPNVGKYMSAKAEHDSLLNQMLSSVEQLPEEHKKLSEVNKQLVRSCRELAKGCVRAFDEAGFGGGDDD